MTVWLPIAAAVAYFGLCVFVICLSKANTVSEVRSEEAAARKALYPESSYANRRIDD